MREHILNKEITREIKAELPVIPREMIKERGCSYCPYYAGTFQKRPRCLLAECAWDNENERFHPALRKMLPEYETAMEKARVKYEERKKSYELLVSMFADELAQEERKKDECYGCVYGKCGPCIGICYKRIMG
ncbi:MAG: hypothetical protein Q4F24_17005 [Eubacteriales bacterium]|nr:hypothetical protein [Eubacteriales bacterium]